MVSGCDREDGVCGCGVVLVVVLQFCGGLMGVLVACGGSLMCLLMLR